MKTASPQLTTPSTTHRKDGYPSRDMFKECLREGFIHAPTYSWSIPFEAIAAILHETDLSEIPEEELP